jgi:hypothetical protein
MTPIVASSNSLKFKIAGYKKSNFMCGSCGLLTCQTWLGWLGFFFLFSFFFFLYIQLTSRDNMSIVQSHEYMEWLHHFWALDFFTFLLGLLCSNFFLFLFGVQRLLWNFKVVIAGCGSSTIQDWNFETLVWD